MGTRVSPPALRWRVAIYGEMLESVRVPVLFTHHFRQLETNTGALMRAIADIQVHRVRELVTAAGQSFDYFSFPDIAHQMHEQDPELFTRLIVEWAGTLTVGTAGIVFPKSVLSTVVV